MLQTTGCGAETVVSSRGVTHHHPEAPLIHPAIAVRSPPTAPPEDIYVPMPAPMPIVTVLAAAPAPVPATPAPAPTPRPASTSPPPPMMSKPSAPIPSHVGREVYHGEYEEIPGWTRGQTRAMREASREYAHGHGLLSKFDHVALVPMLVRRESIHEATRNYSPSIYANWTCLRPPYSDKRF